MVASPIVKAFAAKVAGEIVALAVNTQEAFEAGEAYAIYAVPTLALFRHGEEISRKMGLLPRAELERWVHTSLSPPGDEARA
jgi:thioredoxin-like negative regulator of GroEL